VAGHGTLPTSKRAESVLLAWPLRDDDKERERERETERGEGGEELTTKAPPCVAGPETVSFSRARRREDVRCAQDLLQEIQRFLTGIRDFCLPTLLQL